MGASNEYQWFWEGLDAYLARKGLKQTQQRKQIIELFLSKDDHIDAEELYELARRQGYHVGLATVYRTLNLLKDACLVSQNNFSDGRSVYELLKPGQHHDHLVCLSCGKVVEFENNEIESLQEKIAKEYGFVLISHRLDLLGHCSKCQ